MNYVDSCVDFYVQVITVDRRIFRGHLVSYDQSLNMVLKNCMEISYSNEKDDRGEAIAEETPMGVYLIRGDNCSLISRINETKQNE